MFTELDLVDSINTKALGMVNYVVGSKTFWPDIQKLCQMENAVREIQCCLELLVHRCEKCVEIKGDYVEKKQSCFISVTLKSWSGQKHLDPTTYLPLI